MASAIAFIHNFTTVAFSVGQEDSDMYEDDLASSLYSNTTSLDYSQMDYPKELKYKPVWEMVVKTLFYIVAIVLALVGNIIVIIVVAKNARMHTATNFYIVNLAVADCLVVLTCSWTHLVDDLTPFWVLGSFFCTFNTFSQGKWICVTMKFLVFLLHV
ncbi:substance-p receptor-like [Plakobranchus ocellatus]|uniref:Substance-p receptor-like n=1 Tax=Plakobranchus ocellatus TaxID=259542 RepID=A0AAV4D3Q8_9GAST|nr:substance-p receptor-like [Plakobranchus ocellatus]